MRNIDTLPCYNPGGTRPRLNPHEGWRGYTSLPWRMETRVLRGPRACVEITRCTVGGARSRCRVFKRPKRQYSSSYIHGAGTLGEVIDEMRRGR
jgi:hypothetical protein